MTLLTGCLSPGEDSSLPRGEPVPFTVPAGWPALDWPVGNPYTAEKAALGRLLFTDLRLSRDGKASCSWCHSAAASFADNHQTAFSTGVGATPTRRNTPTLVNVGFLKPLLFDGAVATLEEQALKPLLNPGEMGMTRASVESVLAADTHYVALFARVFGPGPLTLERAAQALATFQRTLVSWNTDYDRWVAGDTGALTPAARRGAALFLSERTRCATCHAPPLFTDGRFHNNGLDEPTDTPPDSGRAGVTRLASDLGRFRTPTLRQTAFTPPYMHDGRFATLSEVLEHYNAGGRPHPGSGISPLGLSPEELSDLGAFLGSLNDLYFPAP